MISVFKLSILCKPFQEKKSPPVLCQLLWAYSNYLVSIDMSSVDPEESQSGSILFPKIV